MRPQVLMVVFEILASHHHMARWHEARIEQHERDLEALQAQDQELQARMAALEHAGPGEEAAGESPGRMRGAADGGASAFAKAAVFGNGSAAEGVWGQEDGAGPVEADVDREGSIAAIVERSLQRAVEIKSAGVFPLLPLESAHQMTLCGHRVVLLFACPSIAKQLHHRVLSA